MRLVLRILSALILTLAAAVLVLTFLPGQKIAQIAARQIEAQTGRELRFDGEVRFTFWPTLGLRANDVSFANAPWAGPEPLLSAGRLNIGVDAADLLRGEIRVTELSAIVPQLNLKTRADGTGNWELSPNEATATETGDGPAGPSAQAFSIQSIAITGAEITYAPHDGPVTQLQHVDLTVDWPDPAGAAALDLTLRPYGAPLGVKGDINMFSAFLGGAASVADLTLTAAGSALRYQGALSLDGTLNGDISAQIADSDALAVALGQPAPQLPQGLGRALTLDGALVFSMDEGVTLDPLRVDLDGNVFAGRLKLGLEDPLRFDGELTAGALTVSSEKSIGLGGGEAASSGWSQEPIDASALGQANGQLSLAFDSLNWDGMVAGPSKITVKVERARAVLGLAPLQLFGGRIDGRLIANNRKGLSVAAKLGFKDLELQQLLTQTAGADQMTGAATGKVNLLGSGTSEHAIMNSLSGDGNFRIGRGRFTGFDLQGLMNPDRGDGGTTVFNAMGASFTAKDGVLRSEDFSSDLDLLQASGAGRIGLGAQDMDFTVTPSAFRAEDGSGLAVPLRIHGPWSNLRYSPDLSEIEELRALEDQAKAAVQKKLSEELDAPVETLEDAGEALRKRVEDEARKQLLKFLGQD